MARRYQVNYTSKLSSATACCFYESREAAIDAAEYFLGLGIYQRATFFFEEDAVLRNSDFAAAA